MVRLRMLIVLIAPALSMAGCGDGGGGDDGPSSEQIFLVQRSAGASDAMNQVVEAASSGILAGGSGSSTPGPHAVPTYPGATPAFDFDASVDLLFDFDELDVDGNDSRPNLSGQIRVVATGTKTGTEAEGEASFAVTVTAETDVTRTNPDTDMETTIPEGASWSYSLEVTWTKTDDFNWSVTAVATTSVDLQDVTVDDGSNVVTVDVVGQRIVTSSFSRDDGHMERERQFEGSLETTVDDGDTVESVVITWQRPGRVRISVLGGMFGPMTEGQVRALFRVALN